MVRRLAVVSALATLLVFAAPSWAAERPGSTESEIARLEPHLEVRALATGPDGRMLVAGIGHGGIGPSGFVRAYLPTGGLDRAFGQGGEVAFAEMFHVPSALAVEPDGQVLVLQTGFPAHLHRLNTDGSPDSSFGPGGVADVDVGSGGDLFPRLALRSDGRIVVAAASSGQGAPATTQVRRYLSDGSPDLGFGSNGEVTLARGGGGLATSIAAQRDGGLLLTTDAGGGAPGIARLSEDGSLDTGFGLGGVARARVGPSGPRRYVNFAYGFDWRPLALPDGRIRIPVTVGPANGVTQIGAVGLTASGHADGRFGRRGLALAPRCACRRAANGPTAPWWTATVASCSPAAPPRVTRWAVRTRASCDGSAATARSTARSAAAVSCEAPSVRAARISRSISPCSTTTR